MKHWQLFRNQLLLLIDEVLSEICNNPFLLLDKILERGFPVFKLVFGLNDLQKVLDNILASQF